MNLDGKVAIITGGKRIGRVVAQALAARGANLVLSYRGSKKEADETVADVEKAGRRASTPGAGAFAASASWSARSRGRGTNSRPCRG